MFNLQKFLGVGGKINTTSASTSNVQSAVVANSTSGTATADSSNQGFGAVSSANNYTGDFNISNPGAVTSDANPMPNTSSFTNKLNEDVDFENNVANDILDTINNLKSTGSGSTATSIQTEPNIPTNASYDNLIVPVEVAGVQIKADSIENVPISGEEVTPNQMPTDILNTDSSKVSNSVTVTPLQNKNVPDSDTTKSTVQFEESLVNHVGQTVQTSPNLQMEQNPRVNHVMQPDQIQPNVSSSLNSYTIGSLLDYVIDSNASDLHLVPGYQPSVRIDGALKPLGKEILTAEKSKELIYSLLSEDKQEILEVNREVDLAYAHGDRGRFRINAYYSKNVICAALRLIPQRIKSIDELRLPQLYKALSNLEQGFVLVTGPTGSGKSSTLAAIIQDINQKYSKHILTLEDPIEYVYTPAKAVVTQREMGQDTNSWATALRSALRQDPDVVLVGEMRDLETIAAAITTAETGHLVFATLHTNSASQTVERIINVFPASQQAEIRAQLAQVLEAVIAQRLIPIKGGGRRAVSEVMIVTDAVRNMIREGKTHQLDNAIRTGSEVGMITMERELVNLVKEGAIDLVTARQYAINPEEVDRLIAE